MFKDPTADEDGDVCKSILLNALEQEIKSGALDMVLLPVLREFNEIAGIVTVQSCAGHRDPEGLLLRGAFIDIQLSPFNWTEIYNSSLSHDIIEKLVAHADLGSVELNYCATEDGVDRYVRLRSHLSLMGEACLPCFSAAAKFLKEFHDTNVAIYRNMEYAASKLKEFLGQPTTRKQETGDPA